MFNYIGYRFQGKYSIFRALNVSINFSCKVFHILMILYYIQNTECFLFYRNSLNGKSAYTTNLKHTILRKSRIFKLHNQGLILRTIRGTGARAPSPRWGALGALPLGSLLMLLHFIFISLMKHSERRFLLKLATQLKEFNRFLEI